MPLVRSLVALALAIAFLFGGLAGQPATRAQADPGFAVGEQVVVDTDAVHFHAAASQSSDVLAVLIDGTVGVVTDGPATADGYVWYRLDVDGTLGWCAADYLQSAAGDHGLMPAGSTAVVVTDLLNLRSEPGLAAAVVTTLASGAALAVLDGPQPVDGYDWYQLYGDGATGWAVRDYLAFMPQEVAVLAVGDIATVNTDTLNLRDDASLTGNVVAVVSGGDEATILDGPVAADGEAWFYVETAAGTGWVAGEYLIV